MAFPGVDMTISETAFDLDQFLPYLLNQAAEATALSFQSTYQTTYGLSRTGWRVMAHLGKFGEMSARDICARSHMEKTKVSRAVAALESAGWINRRVSPQDRRAEMLALTDAGRMVFVDLGRRANEYDQTLRQLLGPDLAAQLDDALRQLIRP